MVTKYDRFSENLKRNKFFIPAPSVGNISINSRTIDSIVINTSYKVYLYAINTTHRSKTISPESRSETRDEILTHRKQIYTI